MQKVDFAGDPELLVGWRRGERLHAGTVPLHDDVVPTLRSVCEGTVKAIQKRTTRPYEPSAELEEGEEIFKISFTELPAPSPRRRAHHQLKKAVEEGLLDELPNAADLVALLELSAHEQIEAGRLAEGGFAFYAIRWVSGGRFISFVKAAAPVVVMKKGMFFFQYSETLRSVERPDFALYADVDLVMTGSAAYVLKKRAFDRLFKDVRVVLQDVPKNANELVAEMDDKVPLTARAVAAVVERCRTRPTYAARLRRAVARARALPLTPELLSEALKRHELPVESMLNDKGELDFAGEQVSLCLDLIEGRLFEDDLSGEHRRADRYSTRKA